MKSIHATVSANAPKALRRQAFTLVELLVVIAIIGILASLLLPTLVRAKEQTKKTQCGNNMRQIMFATRFYGEENQDFLPPYSVLGAMPGPVTPNGVNNTHDKSWADVLYPYVKNTNLFNCPANRSGLRWNIGINLNLAGNISVDTSRPINTVIKWTGVAHPSDTIYFADSQYVTNPAETNADAWVGDPSTSWVHFRTPNDPHYVDLPTRVLNRHSGRAQMGWVDGHTQAYRASQIGLNVAEGDPAALWDKY